jgi:FtsH-binding integral membrane protein
MTALTYKTAGEINEAMGRVYAHMMAAVFNSMLVSYFVGSTPSLLHFFFTGATKWLVIFAPLIFVFAIPSIMNSKISRAGKVLTLHAFAALMGLSFATIFMIYTKASIASAFMGAGVLFGCLSFYGYFTKRDLDSLGKFMFVGLIAIVIASIINIFVGSSLMQMVISAVAIVIFLGLTAYDTQQIREIVSDGEAGDGAELSGAITLYLDFINIFLSLLNLFGDKKD